MLRGNAHCLIDEASNAVLRISSETVPVPAGCRLFSVRAESLPPEVQALSDTPVPFDIEILSVGDGREVAYAEESSAIVIRDDTGDAVPRHARLLAVKFEAMEPKTVMELAILGLVRAVGAEKVAFAALDGGSKSAPAPKAAPRRKKAKS